MREEDVPPPMQSTNSKLKGIYELKAGKTPNLNMTKEGVSCVMVATLKGE